MFALCVVLLHHTLVLCCVMLRCTVLCSLKPAVDAMIRFQASKSKMGGLKVSVTQSPIFPLSGTCSRLAGGCKS